MSGSVERLNALLADRYRIERELGAGGMATVYFAEDLRHHRPVAIKVLRPDLAASLGAERFLREIEIAARLHHPHILPLYDSGGEHDLLFYVMPYVEGESLRHRLSRGALPLAEAVQIIRDVADALAYSHQRGVVHRDIKPENILLSSGHALVTDFGVAKAVSDATTGSALTGAGVTLGTPAYMAPEQATADPGVDHRADLYALGVTAWEMLAGAHPFGVRPPQAMVGAHLSEAPVAIASRRSGIPASLAGLVMRLLSKDPAQRPQRAEDVVRAIDQGALPAGARPRWSRRAVAASAVLVLAVAAGAAVAWNAMSSGAQESPDGEGRIETIAVLPFVNTSGVPGDDYFSDGMTDELAHAVSRIPSVRLAGRTSSYAFKGKSATAQEIGRTLDVEAFVDGTVRRAGERLRVSAQLVSTRDGKVLWDSVFETRSSDVFGIQDEFTIAIVSAISPTLTQGAAATSDVVARGTKDPEAYDLYLKGRYRFLERGAANVAQAVVYLRQAIARDPGFARAHALLANVYGILPVYFADPTDSAMTLSKASARQALALDSTLVDARAALAGTLDAELRFAEAQAMYERAVALEPSNPNVRLWYGGSLLLFGQSEQAVTELRQAVRLDPLNKSGVSLLALALASARRFSEARAVAQGVLGTDPDFVLGMEVMGLVLAFDGEPDSAVRVFERAVQLYPNAPRLHAELIFAYAASGRWGDARRVRDQLSRRADFSGGVNSAFAAMVFGDPAPAVSLLATEAGRRAWFDFAGFGCNPLNDPLWGEPRFVSVMREFSIDPCPLARPWPLSRQN